MNFYAGSALAALIFTASVGVFTWQKSSDRTLGRFYGLVSLAISLWVLGCFGEAFAGQRWALMYDVILYTGACFAPTLFLHFVLYFANAEKRYFKALILNYAASASFVLLNLTIPLRYHFIADVPRKFSYRYIADPNILWYVFAAWYLCPVLLLNYVLYKGYRSATDSHKRNQYLYFLFAASLLAVAGTMYFSLVFTINMPMIDNFFTISYGTVMAYAILHHNLMDIRLVLRDTTVHLATASLLAVAAMLPTLPLSTVHPQMAVTLGILLMAGLMAGAYDPIRKRLQPAIDRVIFSNQFAYLEELAQLPNDILEFSSMREMLNFLVRRLTEAGKLAHVEILMYDPAQQSYMSVIRNSLSVNGAGASEPEWSLPQNSPLVDYLEKTNKLCLKSDLESLSTLDPQAIADLERFQGAACFGVMKESHLSGLVILGHKANREPFNQRDIKILEALKLRIENFLLQALVTTEESLNMVKDSHDMKNDVNALRGRIPLRRFKIRTFEKNMISQLQALSEAIVHGHLPQERLINHIAELQKEVAALSQDQQALVPIEEDALDRLRNKLQNWSEFGRLVSQSFKGTRHQEPVDVTATGKISIERWTPAAQRKFLTLTGEFQGDLHVHGERSLVEQIFDNLIDNAIKATDKGSVSVSCKRKDGKVVIEVRDTGCGFREEALKTILSKPFYQGEGRQALEKSTGIGLVLVNLYVKNLGGEIHVESIFGAGATFRVLLPVLESSQVAA